MRKEEYVVDSFIKTYNGKYKDTEMLFRVHKGYANIEDLKTLMLEKNINLDFAVIVKFLDMYYGIIFEDYNKTYIIGELKTYYVNENYIMIGCNTKTFKMKFIPTSLKKQVYTHQTLAFDLINRDEKLDIIHNGKSILGNEYANTYAVILGLTFIDYYFSLSEAYILSNDYFKQDYTNVFGRDIIGINPFKGKVMLRDGSIKNHQFYGRTSYIYCRHDRFSRY